MITLRGVDFSYPGTKPLFSGFDWVVNPAESWAVLGPSGCGKSTLLYLVSGLRHPLGGQVLVNGIAIEKQRPGTGLVLQDYGLLPWATVRENVALGLRIRQFYGPDGVHAPLGETVGQIDWKCEPWLERMGLMEVAGQYPGQISGGQRQRTAIARTLALNPDLLLMDEPFASLDAPTRQGLQRFMLGLHAERSLTMILVTHSVEEAALMGQKVLVLGKPPHQRAKVISNPGWGRENFSAETEYLEICDRLRTEVEAAL